MGKNQKQGLNDTKKLALRVSGERQSNSFMFTAEAFCRIGTVLYIINLNFEQYVLSVYILSDSCLTSNATP
jgi:hypothetical protein